MRRLFRLAAVLVLLFLFLAVGGVSYYAIPSDSINKMKRGAWIGCWVSRLLLLVLGCDVIRNKNLAFIDGEFVVANHTSYLDILILLSIRPFIFVASTDVEADSWQGLLSRLGGAVFVNRKNRQGLKSSINRLHDLLIENCSIAIFPEATTSNGKSVLPFHPALFKSAVAAKSPVRPVCICYEKRDGRPFGRQDADHIFYYDDHVLTRQFWRLLAIKSLLVRLNFASSPYPGKKFETRELCRLCFSFILQTYKATCTLAAY